MRRQTKTDTERQKQWERGACVSKKLKVCVCAYIFAHMVLIHYHRSPTEPNLHFISTCQFAEPIIIILSMGEKKNQFPPSYPHDFMNP